ncbi:hypothetical protein OAR97_00180 [Arcobacteraceae bacterium]|nr:hypothetical protein [Arcobacteraceae bacterium]
MKKLLTLSSILLVSLLFLTGCRSAAIYNVVEAPIHTKISSDRVFKAIKTAARSRGWLVKKVKNGVAQARINVRGRHSAVVTITYNRKNYSIQYENSHNLKYNSSDNTIHQTYNKWIANLDRAIQFELDSIE